MSFVRLLLQSGWCCAAAWAPLAHTAFAAMDDEVLLGNGLGPLSSGDLQSRITRDALELRAHQLYQCAGESNQTYDHPTRVIGSPGHAATLQYIQDELAALGDYYRVETRTFEAITGSIYDAHLWTANETEIDIRPAAMSPPGNVTAQVAFVDGYGCLPSNYGAEIRGRIALVKRGSCSFGEKSEFAGMKGALGLLVYDPLGAPDQLDSVTLGTPLDDQVPTVVVSRRFASEQVRQGDVINLYVDSEVQHLPTVNILAETTGGDHDNVVMLGSHSDSVSAGPGLNDNGSGSLALLEIAKQLTHFKVNNAVRFAWWSAEEEGLLGSIDYASNLVATEAAKIRMFMDFDMLASPNFAFEIYDSDDSENPVGSGALRDLFIAYYEDHGLNYTLQPFDGRSDYVGFIDIGIPSSGVDTGAEGYKTRKEADLFGGESGAPYDVCYHADCDGLDNLNYEAWLINSRLIAHSVATYAESLDGFPVRSSNYYSQRAPAQRQWPRGPRSALLI